jgi:two-component system sensor histidine kinase CpxA
MVPSFRFAQGPSEVGDPDYGPGVPAESLPQIFEPFFRGRRPDEETGGIGLGLSIAKRAVRLQRGTITAQNAHPVLRVQIAIPTRVPQVL